MRPRSKRLFLILFIIISVLFQGKIMISIADSGPNMKDGLWEITTKMEMEGMPMKMPAMTHSQCITKKNAVPAGSQPGQECKIVENHISGDIVTWKMECDTPEGNVRATGEITYAGDIFEGTIKMQMQGMEMLQHLSGKWIGECSQ